MKQDLLPEQTTKLIELGFEKPKNRLVKQRFDRSTSSWIVVGEDGNYSIGELIEIIDSKVTLEIDKLGARWMVSVLIFDFTGTELINCLFDACVKLKAEGVI